MTTSGAADKRPTLFIGSSKEGLDWARALQRALGHDDCEPQVWTDGLFDQGNTALTSLIQATQNFDFAAFVFTDDDDVVRRGVASKAPRDNVVLELGLFAGALGLDRVFLFRPRQQLLATPSDWWGILDATFDITAQNKQAAMSTAAHDLRERIHRLGIRSKPSEAPVDAPLHVDHGKELTDELNAIVKAAQSQGWSVQKWDGTVFRLVDQSNHRFAIALSDNPAGDREVLRNDLVPKLVKVGLRLSMRVQAPVGADLSTWRPAQTVQPRKKRTSRPTSLQEASSAKPVANKRKGSSQPPKA